MEKWMRVQELYLEAMLREPFLKFFDTQSEELLDEKIEVLTAIIEGKSIAEIPGFYDVLELMPDDNTHWDL